MDCPELNQTIALLEYLQMDFELIKRSASHYKAEDSDFPLDEDVECTGIYFSRCDMVFGPQGNFLGTMEWELGRFTERRR